MYKKGGVTPPLTGPYFPPAHGRYVARAGRGAAARNRVAAGPEHLPWEVRYPEWLHLVLSSGFNTLLNSFYENGVKNAENIQAICAGTGVSKSIFFLPKWNCWTGWGLQFAILFPKRSTRFASGFTLPASERHIVKLPGICSQRSQPGEASPRGSWSWLWSAFIPNGFDFIDDVSCWLESCLIVFG